MMFHRNHRNHRVGRVAVALGVALGVVTSQSVAAQEAPVDLGTATNFAVLAGTTVTNTGSSIISGDLGVSPGSAIVGFPPGVVTEGVIHAADAVALQAQADVTTAFNDAAGRAATSVIAADLGGQTLVSGVYSGGALGLTGTLTLDAQGDPNAVFIFQAASTLITASTSNINLINGADACNVFWQVGSSATLGTNSVFNGTILALTSITAESGATIEGRLLARNGAVTLADNQVSVAICPAAVPPTTTTVPGVTTTVPGVTTTVPDAAVTTVAPVTDLPATGTSTTAFSAAGIIPIVLIGMTAVGFARRRSGQMLGR
jgi:LPXTG-motif cell wall-anchored protein